jgi:Ala-tRNA(Pro) deacylase
MFFVGYIMEKAPDSYKSYLQEAVYESLTKLQIPFERGQNRADRQ